MSMIDEWMVKTIFGLIDWKSIRRADTTGRWFLSLFLDGIQNFYK
jgi:hypothetical protein